MEGPDQDGVNLEESDGEGVRLRPVRLDDLATSHREVVQGVVQFRVHGRLVPEAQKLAVRLQDEISGPPSLDVLAWKSGKMSKKSTFGNLKAKITSFVKPSLLQDLVQDGRGRGGGRGGCRLVCGGRLPQDRAGGHVHGGRHRLRRRGGRRRHGFGVSGLERMFENDIFSSGRFWKSGN